MPEVFDFEISQDGIDFLEVLAEEQLESFNHVDRFDELEASLEELREIEQECSKENWGGMNEIPVAKKTIDQSKGILIRSANLPYIIQLPNLSPTPSGLIEMEWYKEKGHRFGIRLNDQGVFIFSGLFGHKVVDDSGNIMEEDIHGTSLVEDEKFPNIIKEQLSRLYDISLT